MKKKLAAIFLIVALAVTFASMTVLAAVETTTPNMVQKYFPPSSVVEGSLESDTEVYVFNEKQGILLSSTVVTEPFKTIPSQTILAGTYVNSHLVHFDPPGTSQASVSGSVNFNGDILGIYCTNEGLCNTDVAFGLTGTQYPPAGSHRRLEVAGTGGDTITISGSQLTVDLNAASNIDQIRVITEGTFAVGGGAYPINKIGLLVPWIALAGIVLFGAVLLIRRRAHN